MNEPLELDKKLEDRFYDVSYLGPVNEGSRILAKKNCRNCHGRGMRGWKLSEPTKETDVVKQTNNKTCPCHTVRSETKYNTRVPIFCQCLREYKKPTEGEVK